MRDKGASALSPPPLIDTKAVNGAKGTARKQCQLWTPPTHPLEAPVTPTPAPPRHHGARRPLASILQGWHAPVPQSLAPVCHQHSAFGAPEFTVCPPAPCARPCPWRARRAAAPRCPYRPPLPLIGALGSYRGRRFSKAARWP